MTPTATRVDWLARFERFELVGSTNDVVGGWLRDGTPEVCIATSDTQLGGRGRAGRSWIAPPGAALLLSVGFRPTWLDPGHAWRLGAIVSLAMAEACEAAMGLASGTVRLKWPNDLVAIDGAAGDVRKLGGVLGETEGLGAPGALAVIGIGVNAAWDPATFPADLQASMTSLAAVSHAVPDRDAILEAFVGRLGPAVEGLRSGSFAAEDWRARQLTSGVAVRLQWPDGGEDMAVAMDVDAETGALLVDMGSGTARSIVVGEIRHLRVGPQV